MQERVAAAVEHFYGLPGKSYLAKSLERRGMDGGGFATSLAESTISGSGLAQLVASGEPLPFFFKRFDIGWYVEYLNIF